METKPLLYGLIGFFIGGLLVSVAATAFSEPSQENSKDTGSSVKSMTMDDMTAEIKNKKNDEYDKAFIANMIAHHVGAVEMAKLSAANAKHDEIKALSEEIIAAQEKEIIEMRQWQKDWGYPVTNHDSMGH